MFVCPLLSYCMYGGFLAFSLCIAALQFQSNVFLLQATLSAHFQY